MTIQISKNARTTLIRISYATQMSDPQLAVVLLSVVMGIAGVVCIYVGETM